MDEYRKSPQTCPEEVILQIGKMGDTIPADMMARIIQEQINWEQQQFPGVKVLDVALHMDEQGAPHIHERRAWVYTDKTAIWLSVKINPSSRWGLNCRTQIDPGAGLTIESKPFPGCAESISCRYAENTGSRLKKYHRRKAEAVCLMLHT